MSSDQNSGYLLCIGDCTTQLNSLTYNVNINLIYTLYYIYFILGILVSHMIRIPMNHFRISCNVMIRVFERCSPWDPNFLSSEIPKLDHPACSIRFSGWSGWLGGGSNVQYQTVGWLNQLI